MLLVFGVWLTEIGVTEWENILDENDVNLEFSRDNCRKVFSNPEFFGSLNTQLFIHGSNYSNYLFDEVTEDIKQIKKK